MSMRVGGEALMRVDPSLWCVVGTFVNVEGPSCCGSPAITTDVSGPASERGSSASLSVSCAASSTMMCVKWPCSWRTSHAHNDHTALPQSTSLIRQRPSKSVCQVLKSLTSASAIQPIHQPISQFFIHFISQSVKRISQSSNSSANQPSVSANQPSG